MVFSVVLLGILPQEESGYEHRVVWLYFPVRAEDHVRLGGRSHVWAGRRPRDSTGVLGKQTAALK